jgi:hypothetical protein
VLNISRVLGYVHTNFRHTDVNGVVHVWIGNGTMCGAPSYLFANLAWVRAEDLAPTCMSCLIGVVCVWPVGKTYW